MSYTQRRYKAKANKKRAVAKARAKYLTKKFIGTQRTIKNSKKYNSVRKSFNMKYSSRSFARDMSYWVRGKKA